MPFAVELLTVNSPQYVQASIFMQRKACIISASTLVQIRLLTQSRTSCDQPEELAADDESAASWKLFLPFSV
jgi:hypothetical protein